MRFALLYLLISPLTTLAHEGPDPLARWRMDADAITQADDGATLKARLGPDAKIVGGYELVGEGADAALFLNGGEGCLEVAADHRTAAKFLPTDALTVAAWVSVDKPLRYGGIVGCVLDNGNDEFGWVVGYDETTFTFALCSEDGGGVLTYLKGRTKYEPGRLHHVVAVYDGETMELYVDGKLDASSEAQSGPIAYPQSTPFVLGAYKDSNEYFGHRGRLVEVAIYDQAAKAKWVAHDYEHDASRSKLPPVIKYEPLALTVTPYLQFSTQTGMTVMWRTNRPALGTVHWGETAACSQRLRAEGPSEIHELRLTDLEPETQYFYRTETVTDEGKKLVSDVATFQTAVRPETPFAFAVISDTQGNPKVSGKIAAHAWGQRPSFLLHPGDLVSTGGDDRHWTQHFFPGMQPLIRHVPFYPVLGNHEQNAKNYYDYVSLPAPEYYYEFAFGNAHFFMIDTNRNVGPGSAQYRWLDAALSNSEATWKIVCHHHPPYSSDENDYGDLWKTNKGTRGDTRVRALVPLYERHDVDIVWNGHIHSYERTWPIKANKAVVQDAPVYMITGGGGGHLETPGPVRPFFMHTVRRGHHYCMVRVNGTKLEIRAYDIENRLFDQTVIEKR